MTTTRKELQARLEAEWTHQGRIMAELNTVKWSIKEMASCMDRIGEDGNPDEYSRGMTSAYEDVAVRLSNLTDNIDCWDDELGAEHPVKL